MKKAKAEADGAEGGNAEGGNAGPTGDTHPEGEGGVDG
jgi:hypothetical protein